MAATVHASRKPMRPEQQLGLNFNAPIPDAREPGSMPAAIPWKAPAAIAFGSGGTLALARACSIQNAYLAADLLALPIAWDFNAPFADTHDGPKKAPAAPLAHLLTASSSRYYGRGNANPGRDAITEVALSMIERGASFIQADPHDECPLTLCAYFRRVEVFESLAGHPEFTYSRLKALRVGSRPLPESPADDDDDDAATDAADASTDAADASTDTADASTDTADAPDSEEKHDDIDNRTPLLGHLIETSQTSAAKALIESAGFPVNGLDPDGRLPIGYCPDVESIEALIGLGADPALADSHGRNALARAQSVPDTATREKMIGRIATELKRGYKANPSILATLQAENISALLEAAQNAPKSSLLKNISAFKFDVATARDPKTLLTPLMAAFRGGRMASAEHLLAAGCDINARDINGVSAASHLLVGKNTSNGPSSVDIARKHAHTIDFSSRSARGWPVALETAFLMGSASRNYDYRHQPAQALGAACEASDAVNAPFETNWLVGDDGSTLMDAYFKGGAGKGYYRRGENLVELFDLSERFKVPHSLDRALAAALAMVDNPNDISSPYTQDGRAFDSLKNRFDKKSEPTPAAALVLSRKPKLARALAGSFPAIYAACEAAEIARAAGAGSRAPSGKARL